MGTSPESQDTTLVQLPGAPITCAWCGKAVRIALRHAGGLRCLCGAALVAARKAARCPQCGDYKNHGDDRCDRCYWADDALDLDVHQPIPYRLTEQAHRALQTGIPGWGRCARSGPDDYLGRYPTCEACALEVDS